MKTYQVLTALAIAALTCAAAQAAPITGPELKKALQNNPQVLLEAITANKRAILEILNQAAQEERALAQKEAAEAEARALEESFKNPLVPAIDANTRIRGEKDAKYTLVEYSDFQCPYCARGFQNVEELRKKYGKDLRFIFKNLPLPFHDKAMPAAQWLEAVALQSPEKSWQFHDTLFSNQDKLGLEFFKETAKGLGLDVVKCEADAASQGVKDRIAADMAEAEKFGFSGTPGYLINGVPVKGAYPVDYFDGVIKKIDAAKTEKSK
ncbi:MAG TPA: thioredoxin domain-containing protein [Elusimicrobiales bacterium]|nr:thioredoxin domain-containing protein [Elusimicrobiales bacterium]